MSDWADFCEFSGIDPNDPEEFDNLLEEYSNEIEKITLTHKISGRKYSFKSIANPFCQKCGGTGYLGIFKRICNGRCFKCIPDHLWNQLTIGN